jgi:hypothetical protein
MRAFGSFNEVLLQRSTKAPTGRRLNHGVETNATPQELRNRVPHCFAQKVETERQRREI